MEEKYEVNGNLMTIKELKDKILSYQHPKYDPKNKVRDGCCICTRVINGWFHGSGKICSPECSFIYTKTFGKGGMPQESIDPEVRKFMRVRHELWQRRGWTWYKDVNKVQEWLKELPEGKLNQLSKQIEFEPWDDVDEPKFIAYLITRMLNRWRFENEFSDKFDDVLEFLKSEKGQELRYDMLNSLMEENIKHLEDLHYQSEKDKEILEKLKNRLEATVKFQKEFEEEVNKLMDDEFIKHCPKGE